MRFRHHLAHLLFLGALGAAVPGVPVLLAAPGGHPLERAEAGGLRPGPAPTANEEVEQVVAGDMVVDWIGGAPAGATEAMSAGHVPAELTVTEAPPDPASDHGHHDQGHDGAGVDAFAAVGSEAEVVEHHDAASGGFALFSTSARWLPSGYTVRLTGADGRIEQLREVVVAAARSATELTGVPVRVASSSGGPVDPARGEIVVVLGSGPCGSDAVGCGGPGLTAAELRWGRVWVHPSALSMSAAQRANLTAHELGHALGLQHFDASWTDGRQVMYPTITGVTTFRSGDAAGLRHMAGVQDRSAGAVTSRSYAAGRVHVTGSVASGTRVRLASGAVATEVTASGGRFLGGIPLPAGTHVVCATSLDAAAGYRRDMGCGSVDAPGTPLAHGDGVRSSAAGIKMSGWAIDPQTAGPVVVEVRRNGALVASVRADRQRNDLGDLARHYGTAHGFAVEILAEVGRNRVCVRVLGVGGGGHLDAGCADVDHAVVPAGVLGGGEGRVSPPPGSGPVPALDAADTVDLAVDRLVPVLEQVVGAVAQRPVTPGPAVAAALGAVDQP